VSESLKRAAFYFQSDVTKLPSFLDFEASSLSSTSYPIEVAWSRPDGSIESHLISPVGIDGWDDWSFLSEKVHGISRDELIAYGQSPARVCSLMNHQLSGQVVYTDNPIYDGMWLAELFSVVKGGRTKFKLGLVDEVLFRDGASGAPTSDKIQEMKEEARKRVGGQHRARLDVQYLIELYKIASGSK
jgi:hypothetical protein